MEMHRVSTTISTNHWELLKNYTEEYGTQQKVLELALENLKRKPKTSSKLLPDELLWLRMYKELKPTFVCIHNEIVQELLSTADIERLTELLTRMNFAEYQVVFYYQKPLKELSLKEVVDGIVITTKMVGFFDALGYSENASYHTLKATHKFGSIISCLFKIFFENLFKAYGVKTQCSYSQHGVFIKIFKNV